MFGIGEPLAAALLFFLEPGESMFEASDSAKRRCCQ